MIRLAEELLVFLLDKQSGDLTPVPDRTLHYALAGTVLMDLALEGRIDTDVERLVMVDPTPLNDGLLDPALALIVEDAGARDTAHWIERLATPEIAGRVRDGAIGRLIERGILERDSGGILSLTRLVRRARRYPVVEGEGAVEVDARIMGVLFADDVPNPRDAMLIAVVNACGIFDRLLSPEERADVADRIDLLGRLDLIGRSISEAIRKAASPMPRRFSGRGSDRTARALTAIPVADGGGLPIVGNAFGMAGDLSAYLVKQYRKLGPVFRIRAFSRAFTVLAGTEANRFFQRHGRLYLRSVDFYNPLSRALGAHRLVIGMDGAEHFKLRKALTNGYSRAYCSTASMTPSGSWPARPTLCWRERRRRPCRSCSASSANRSEYSVPVWMRKSPWKTSSDTSTR